MVISIFCDLNLNHLIWSKLLIKKNLSNLTRRSSILDSNSHEWLYFLENEEKIRISELLIKNTIRY